METKTKMARSASPGGFSNYEDDSLFQNAVFTHDISEQMRVPKRIRATGDYFDDHELLSNGNGEINSWNYHDKIEMNVPDRIVVLGQDQHLGECGFGVFGIISLRTIDCIDVANNDLVACLVGC